MHNITVNRSQIWKHIHLSYLCSHSRKYKDLISWHWFNSLKTGINLSFQPFIFPPVANYKHISASCKLCIYFHGHLEDLSLSYPHSCLSKKCLVNWGCNSMFSEGNEHNTVKEIQLHCMFILQWLITGVMMMMIRCCLRTEIQWLVLITWN